MVFKLKIKTKKLFLFIQFFSFSKVMAAASLANIVKSSLGPLGLDKMLVDDIGVNIKLNFKINFILF